MSHNNAYDAIIVGAGFSGLHALHRLRERGLKVRVYEVADGVGGTWYWNRYPGARVDFESFEYSYSFSEELQQDWHWQERYSAQPQLLEYLNHVADRFDLRRDIQFQTRVTAAHFDETNARWQVTTDHGDPVSARFLVMATGLLSTPKTPDMPGLDDFQGRKLLTARWPHEPVDFSGQRVGVIGTGSTGVQVITTLAPQVKDLLVFQRTAPYVVPANNGPMTAEYEASIKAQYDTLRHNEFHSETGCVLLNGTIESLPLPRDVSALAVSDAERRAEYEARWRQGALYFVNAYNDLITDLDANETFAAFMREKIRAAVKDPATAEKLTPRGYPVFARRLSVCDGYYETYNRDNVALVDIAADPIAAFTAHGLRTASGTQYPLDSVIFATGFDAQTGTLKRIDIRGRGGLALADAWRDGPRQLLGLMTCGFPNMVMLCGPGSPTAFYPPILLGEYQTEWLIKCVDELDRRGLRTFEPSEAAQREWVEHSAQIADMTLYPKGRSWYMGDNIPGKPRVLLSYIGGFTEYRRRADQAAAHFGELILTP